MKKFKVFLSVLTCLIFLSSFGFSNGLNLNGLGARMVAMGGAFVGLADDFSAALWNPAGLAQMKGMTFGLSGDIIIPSGTYQFDTFQIDTKSESKMYPAGMAGFFTPIGDNLVAGISVHTPSGLGASWPSEDLAPLAGIPFIGNADVVWESFIGVITIAPAVAFSINDMFYLGATLNINYGMFDIQRTAGYYFDLIVINTDFGPIVLPYFLDLGQYEESSTGWGFGGTLGLLVKPADIVSFGVTFRTPSKVKFEGEASIENFDQLGLPTSTNFTREVTSPMWLGLGVAFHPTDNITITTDAHYTNWGKLDRVATEFDDIFWQIALAEESDLELMWADKWQFRFGFEYWINDNFAVRAGYYNDPAPSPDTTMNVLVPNYDFNAISGGIGIALNGFTIDVTAEYLFGKDRDVAFVEANEMPGLYGMNVFAASINLIYEWVK